MEWDGTALDDDQLSCTGYSGNELKLGSSFTRLGNYKKLFRPSQGAACLTVQDVLSAIAQTELHYRRAIATCPSTCMLGPLSRLAACGRAIPTDAILFRSCAHAVRSCVCLLPGVPGRADMLAIHNSKAKVVAYGADRIDNWTIFFHGGCVLKGSPGEYHICDEWSEQPAPAAAAAP